MINDTAEPLGYFSKKFSTTQIKYSTYDRERTAMYLAVKHFRDLVEGRPLHIHTDHKPLVYVFKQQPEKASPRQVNYLSYISQFTTDIQYIMGEENTTADLLSRVETISASTTNDQWYKQLADDQESDAELQNLLSGNSPLNSMKLIQFTLPRIAKHIIAFARLSQKTYVNSFY